MARGQFALLHEQMQSYIWLPWSVHPAFSEKAVDVMAVLMMWYSDRGSSLASSKNSVGSGAAVELDEATEPVSRESLLQLWSVESSVPWAVSSPS